MDGVKPFTSKMVRVIDSPINRLFTAYVRSVVVDARVSRKVGRDIDKRITTRRAMLVMSSLFRSYVSPPGSFATQTILLPRSSCPG